MSKSCTDSLVIGWTLFGFTGTRFTLLFSLASWVEHGSVLRESVMPYHLASDPYSRTFSDLVFPSQTWLTDSTLILFEFYYTSNHYAAS